MIPAIIGAIAPAVVSAVKEILQKKAPEVADSIDKILADPQTKVELERIALEKAKLDIEKERLGLEDVNKARELAQTDVMSDSFLSKNVRPLILVYLTAVMSILVLHPLIMPAVKIPEEIISTFSSMTSLAYIFYFGSRGLEKIAIKIWGTKK